MKIDIGKEWERNSLISHIVLIGMSEAVAEQVAEEKKETDNLVEVKITVNDKEINIESFLKEWESQVDGMIENEARSIIDKKMSGISDTLDGLNDRFEEKTNELYDFFKEEVNKRLASKEI